MRKSLNGSMRSAFSKDIFRSIKGSWGRFFAILVIVALGAGFYAGLRMTAPDMRLSADQYYDGTHLYDIEVMSTLGISDEQIDELRTIEGVEAVMPAYQIDASALIEGEQYALRVHSLDTSAAVESDTSDGVNALSDDAGYLNRPILVSGSWPTEQGQCVLSAETITSQPLKIGDTVQMTEGILSLEDTLATNTYTIVGFVRSPYYSSCESLGVTSLGTGVIDQYMFISEDSFAQDFPYVQAFLSVEGAREQAASSEEYKNTVAQVKDRVDQMAPRLEAQRQNDIKRDAQDELDSSRADLDRERTDVQAQLDDGASELNNAQATLNSTYSQLSEASETMHAKEDQLNAGEQALKESRAEFDKKVREGEGKIEEARAAIAAMKASGQDPALIAIAEAQLEEQVEQAQAMKTKGQTKIDEVARELSQGWAALMQAKSEYDQGYAQYEQGRTSYEASVAEYENKKAEAEKEFSDAEVELADAQMDIDAVEAPQFYVMDRTKNYGATSFNSDAGRIDQIAQVFPLLFFLVAALVALTTMTRMVEEERVLIGTYKALGYRKGRIASKYLIYAFLASALGCVVGISILPQILPKVIMGAYSVMYDIPAGPMPIDVPIALLSATLGIGVTCFAAWAAAAASLRTRPAALMLPRTPKSGKRIWLEHIGPVWRRLSFTWKVTGRNIFRYKKRLAMTLIGIAGCTALLLTGFGLNNAIDDIIDKQFGNIYHYNAGITVEEDISEEDNNVVAQILEDPAFTLESAKAFTRGMAALGDDGKEYSLHMIVPEQPEELADLFVMRERISQERLVLDKRSIVITEKLATQLDVGIGDTITFAEQDAAGYTTDERYDFTVGGIMENYVAHYVFVHPALYEQVIDEKPTFIATYATMTTDPELRKQANDTLVALEGVRTVSFNDEVIESYETGLAGVDMIVYVLIIAAAALAFVVLYNLTNINITERQREIATLKVLGFTKREVNSYIFRETLILTLIGAAIGLVLGIFMEGFVVATAEVDAVMFGREIHPPSFIMAFVLTAFFAAIVAFFMRGKLFKIDMVESLKSIE